MSRGLRWACLLLVAAGSAALAQEQKQKQKEEPREEEEKPRVYTNEDLETAGRRGGIVTAPATPRPAGARARGVRGVRPGLEGEARGEAYWRERASTARERLADAETRVEALEQQLAELMQDRNPTAGVLSPTREQERQARLTKAREDLGSAEAEVEAAREGLEELRREARRARVPPGWLR